MRLENDYLACLEVPKFAYSGIQTASNRTAFCISDLLLEDILQL